MAKTRESGLLHYSRSSPGKVCDHVLDSLLQDWLNYSPILNYRFVFIPLFLICNVRPNDRGLTDVYLASDVAYIIVMAIFR